MMVVIWLPFATAVTNLRERKSMQSDPETGQLEPLFKTRTQVWTDQFVWVSGGTHIIGVTPTGRATVTALRLNNENVVKARSI